jgi:putative NADH-flavin reductase
MKLIVFGATGNTGLALLEQAPKQGHQVTAFARSADKLAGIPDITIVTGDVLDEAQVTEAIRGHDVVLSCLGTRPWRHTNICSDGIRVIASAMGKVGIKRVIALSTQGIGDSSLGLFGRMGAALILRKAFADKAVMERALEATDLDWIVVRPGLLTNGKPRGTWRVSLTNELRGGTIARADVAAFMLQQLTADEYVRKRPVIVY